MCGLVGFVDGRSSTAPETMSGLVEAMALRLEHRGPDDSGHWVDADLGVALGSRRLAIIDISSAGHQPMTSGSGRYVLAYNGEIYNARALAQRLEEEGRGRNWRGHSDTEVLVEALEAWGLDVTLERLNGMFAFALHDREERTLHLVRDRLGIKPLYYAEAGASMMFGSELKALEAHPGFDRTIDRRWLDSFLRGLGTPSERTVYESCRQLPAGSVLTIDVTRPQEVGSPRPYWSAAEHLYDPATAAERTVDDVEDELAGLLLDAVERRLVADVPLGLLLSGGIDSSTVLALAQAASNGRVKTFTVGFEDQELDESLAARRIAAHLGSDHTESVARSDDLREIVPRLPEIMDEPFSDPTIISTYLAYRLASEHATVVLSGDGGDEVFAGYPRHRSIESIWRWTGWAPMPARQLAARALTVPSEHRWDQLAAATRRFLPARARQRTVGAKVYRLARWLPAGSPAEMYARATSLWEPSTRLVQLDEHETGEEYERGRVDGRTLGEQIFLAELGLTLQRAQLTKVDRASMASSVEARVPLLDHRVVEFALGLPPHLTYGQPEPKRLLKRVLERYVPRELFERPKSGFLLPLGEWLRGPLRDWASALLAPARLEAEGHLSPAAFEKRWRLHLDGHADQTSHLWPALMFELWLEARAA